MVQNRCQEKTIMNRSIGLKMLEKIEALVSSIPAGFWFGKRASEVQLLFLARRYGNLLERDIIFLVFRHRKLTTDGVDYLLGELEAGRNEHILASPDHAWIAPTPVEVRF